MPIALLIIGYYKGDFSTVEAEDVVKAEIKQQSFFHSCVDA